MTNTAKRLTTIAAVAAALAACAQEPPPPRRIAAIPEAPCVRPFHGRCDATPFPPPPTWYEKLWPYHL